MTDAIFSFIFNHPLLAFAIWITVACSIFGWFEERRNLRGGHL